jgi:CBS domain-containing protein
MITIKQCSVVAEEILAHTLTHIHREASVLDASKLMRKSATTELLVTDEINGMLFPIGMLTANDIVMHVIAAGLDPAVFTTGDIAWPGMAAGSITDSDSERPQCMRQNSSEALAVLDDEGRLVGTVRLDEFMVNGDVTGISVHCPTQQ